MKRAISMSVVPFVITFALLVWIAVTPARPASKFVGTWYAGDNVQTLRLDVRDNSRRPWGTAVGSGYIPTLEVRRPGTATVYAIVVCAWEDATNTAVLVTLGSQPLLYPSVSSAADVFADYEATLVLTKGGSVARLGADDAGAPFKFRIQRYP